MADSKEGRGEVIKGAIGSKTAGEIDGISVEEVKTFIEFGNPINGIVPVSDTQAWVCDDCSDDVKLFSLPSLEQVHMVTNYKTLTSWHDFIVLDNGDFIVTDHENKVIRRVTTGADDVIASTGPLSPTWISKTEADDILVSLRDDGDYYDLDPSSRRIVQQTQLTGEVLHTYEFREDGTRLFTIPAETAESGNSDICVINRTDTCPDIGELIVLRGDGRVRFTYRGRDDSIFTPVSVACDSKRRIIVSDRDNQSLHLLSPDGIFLGKLMSDMRGDPGTLALRQNKLWVGFIIGIVKVYKYTDQYAS